jgi:hypothetical protein
VKSSNGVIPGEAACHVKAEGGDGSGDPESIFKTSNIKPQTSNCIKWIPDNGTWAPIYGMTICFTLFQVSSVFSVPPW